MHPSKHIKFQRRHMMKNELTRQLLRNVNKKVINGSVPRILNNNQGSTTSRSQNKDLLTKTTASIRIYWQITQNKDRINEAKNKASDTADFICGSILMAKYCSENVYMVRPHKQNPSVGLTKTGVNFHTTIFQEFYLNGIN